MGIHIRKIRQFINAEIPTGTINGVNDTFTLNNSPISGTVKVYLNGLRQEEGSGKDIIINGSNIIFSSPPETGDIILIDYQI